MKGSIRFIGGLLVVMLATSDSAPFWMSIVVGIIGVTSMFFGAKAIAKGY